VLFPRCLARPIHDGRKLRRCSTRSAFAPSARLHRRHRRFAQCKHGFSEESRAVHKDSRYNPDALRRSRSATDCIRFSYVGWCALRSVLSISAPQNTRLRIRLLLAGAECHPYATARTAESYSVNAGEKVIRFSRSRPEPGIHPGEPPLAGKQ
jgi:hypothetical protein